MSGFQHAIAGGNGVIVVTVFKSPNYVPGVSGWAVFKDGSVEFNDGTFRGFIVGGSLFIYDGTPGLGNPPVYSITDATADPYRNTVEPGFSAHDGTANAVLHVNPAIGGPALEMITGAASESETAAIYTLILNKGLANETISTYILGPASTLSNIQGLIQLVSAAADLSALGGGTIYAGAGGVFDPVAFWNIDGFRSPDFWHTLPLASGWTQNPSNPVRYKLGLDRMVMFTGQATHAAFSTTTVLSASPLLGTYWPAVAQDVPPSFVNSVGSTQGVNVTAAGVVQVRANSSSTTTVAVQGAYPLD